MRPITLTSLRQNIFQIADRVLASGEAVVIERDGKRLILAPETPPDVLENLPRRHAIIGDADELAELSAWDEQAWRDNQSDL